MKGGGNGVVGYLVGGIGWETRIWTVFGRLRLLGGAVEWGLGVGDIGPTVG